MSYIILLNSIITFTTVLNRAIVSRRDVESSVFLYNFVFLILKRKTNKKSQYVLRPRNRDQLQKILYD